ncbi:hypothetical protein CJ199_12885, partial [Brevibacterium paucivorans]
STTGAPRCSACSQAQTATRGASAASCGASTRPVMVFSVYLLFAGHNLPGGGFAAGLVAGLAFIMRYLAGGRWELAEAAPINAGLLLGLGMTMAALTAVGGLLWGDAVLSSVFV